MISGSAKQLFHKDFVHLQERRSRDGRPAVRRGRDPSEARDLAVRLHSPTVRERFFVIN